MWKRDSLFYDFFNDPLNSYNVINAFLHSHYLLDNGWHFFDHLLNVRNNLFDFLYLLFYQDLLNNLLYLLDLDHCLNYWHDFFNDLRCRDDSLDDLLLRDYLLD